MALRPYQNEAVENVLSAFGQVQKVMLQMPTGVGKTEVFSELINHFVTQIVPGKRVLVLVHTRELVHQIQKRLVRRYGLQSGLILSGHEVYVSQITGYRRYKDD